jgi:hypothetical protein
LCVPAPQPQCERCKSDDRLDEDDFPPPQGVILNDPGAVSPSSSPPAAAPKALDSIPSRGERGLQILRTPGIRPCVEGVPRSFTTPETRSGIEAVRRPSLGRSGSATAIQTHGGVHVPYRSRLSQSVLQEGPSEPLWPRVWSPTETPPWGGCPVNDPAPTASRATPASPPLPHPCPRGAGPT